VATHDHTAHARPPNPPGDTPSGYRAVCIRRRHGWSTGRQRFPEVFLGRV